MTSKKREGSLMWKGKITVMKVNGYDRIVTGRQMTQNQTKMGRENIDK